MNRRIAGYDIARALAIFGMVLVNYKIVMGTGQDGPRWLVLLAGLFEGRAAATFVILAGIGISLLTREARVSNDPVRLARNRRTLLRRAAFLFLAGLLHTSVFSADILHFYGVYIAVAALMLVTPTRRLWVVSGVLVMAFVVMAVTLDYERSWNWETLEYRDLWSPAGTVRHLIFNGFHPVVPWLAFLLVGMVLGRQDMRHRGTRRRVFAWGAGVALAAESLSWLCVHTFTRSAGPADEAFVVAIFGTAPMPPMPFYMLAAGGTASAVIAASVAVGERYQGAAWLRPLVATGQLALTLYVAHVVVGMSVLDAMGRLGDQTLPEAMAAISVFCVVGVAFSVLWLRRFRRGPLEAIMRALTDPKQYSEAATK